MFQFPEFAASRLCIHHGLRAIRPEGFPIRKSPDQSLLAAPRSLSQLSTSFFASDCLGIHHTPFVAYRIPKARIEVAHRIRSASVTARRNRCEISTGNNDT